jgi:hypothetical protein
MMVESRRSSARRKPGCPAAATTKVNCTNSRVTCRSFSAYRLLVGGIPDPLPVHSCTSTPLTRSSGKSRVTSRPTVPIP